MSLFKLKPPLFVFLIGILPKLEIPLHVIASNMVLVHHPPFSAKQPYPVPRWEPFGSPSHCGLLRFFSQTVWESEIPAKTQQFSGKTFFLSWVLASKTSQPSQHPSFFYLSYHFWVPLWWPSRVIPTTPGMFCQWHGTHRPQAWHWPFATLRLRTSRASRPEGAGVLGSNWMEKGLVQLNIL